MSDRKGKPVAPVHLIRSKPKFDSESGHHDEMTADGKLLCPSGSSDEDCRKDYEITTVVGLYPKTND